MGICRVVVQATLAMASPLKIKCFSWLCTENYISTWDNLLKCGWIGPNRGCLCNTSSETVNHLFVSCNFSQDVTNSLATSHRMVFRWNDPSLWENLNSWTTPAICHSLLHLPFFISGVFGILVTTVFLII